MGHISLGWRRKEWGVIVEPLQIPEVLLLRPRIIRDDRGHFLEIWHYARYAEAGLPSGFVQDNVSVSRQGVLRGLHFQHPRAQGKLLSCLGGAVFDVAVDVRVGSLTFGRWVSAELSDRNGHQLWVPAGFAHGFLVLSEEAVVAYKCTDFYAPDNERSIRWDDPDIGITWPKDQPTVSAKDGAAPFLAAVPPAYLPLTTRGGG